MVDLCTDLGVSLCIRVVDMAFDESIEGRMNAIRVFVSGKPSLEFGHDPDRPAILLPRKQGPRHGEIRLARDHIHIRDKGRGGCIQH